MEELVSVVIPTYNRADLVLRAIDSVLNQTYNNLEVIVCDDGSTDNTKEVVSAIDDNRVIYVGLKNNSGQSVARNVGVKRAKGKYIAFNDSDDVWHKDKLAKQIKILSEDNNSKVCFCKYEVVGEDNIVVPIEESFDCTDCENGFLDILIRENKVGMPTVVIEKQLFEQVGGFDESLRTVEDWELILRLADKTSFKYINEKLVDVYAGKQSVNTIIGQERAKAEIKIVNMFWNKYINKDIFYHIFQRIYDDVNATNETTMREFLVKELNSKINVYEIISLLCSELRQHEEKVWNLNNEITYLSDVVKEREAKVWNLNNEVNYLSDVVRERDPYKYNVEIKHKSRMASFYRNISERCLNNITGPIAIYGRGELAEWIIANEKQYGYKVDYIVGKKEYSIGGVPFCKIDNLSSCIINYILVVDLDFEKKDLEYIKDIPIIVLWEE